MTMMPNVIQFQLKPLKPELRRPRLLAMAARAGLSGYRRGRELRRILGCDDLPSSEVIVSSLRHKEAALDIARREAWADYDLQRHVLLLVAILAETRLAQSSPAIFPGKASPARP